MSRPALPRASSATSGFFFCGMIEEPVAYASSISIQPNSCEDQSTISSPSRDRWTPISAAAKQNSAAKSRSETASIEFGAAAAKPSSAANCCGSIGSEEPASAPAPSGLTAARLSQSRSLLTSRVNACTWASSWWANSTGCACCRWVMPGAGRSPHASACAISAVCSSASRDTTSRAWSRRYRRRSVATWSLRLRPARSLPPSEPSRSSSPRSSAVCTSSSAMVGRKVPSSTASSRSSSAASIESASSSVSSPARCSIRACAREASRSYLASRQSKCTLSDSRASASAGPPSNRPPHNRVAGAPSAARPFPSVPPISDSTVIGPGLPPYSLGKAGVIGLGLCGNAARARAAGDPERGAWLRPHRQFPRQAGSRSALLLYLAG